MTPSLLGTTVVSPSTGSGLPNRVAANSICNPQYLHVTIG